MRVRKRNYFANLLIFFSIILIVCGALLQIRETSVLSPIDDVVVLDDENSVTITTVPDSIVDDSKDDVEDKAPIDSTNDNSNLNGSASSNDSSSSNSSSSGSSNSSNSGSSSSSSSGNSNNSSSSSNSGSSNNSGGSSNSNSSSSGSSSSGGGNVYEKPLTIEETNAKLRESIQSTYGVTIKYGNETSGYSVGGLTTTVIPDALSCQNALNNLNSALSLYPSGFFKELSTQYNPLTFYLIKRYSKENVTGVTESSSTKTDISIAIDFGFGETFHHEVYHYIEYYMNSKGFYYTSWNTLNPVGFSYGTINQSYSYDSTFAQDSYFVNSYAQTEAPEDRASTFEYMMSNSKASCLNSGMRVWSKAKAMSEAIDYYLNSVSPYVTEHWERFVY